MLRVVTPVSCSLGAVSWQSGGAREPCGRAVGRGYPMAQGCKTCVLQNEDGKQARQEWACLPSAD